MPVSAAIRDKKNIGTTDQWFFLLCINSLLLISVEACSRSRELNSELHNNSDNLPSDNF